MSETSLNTGEMLFQLRAGITWLGRWTISVSTMLRTCTTSGGRSVFRRSPIRTCRW